MIERRDERSAKVQVFTYKEGLLSAVAHDLALEIARFSIELEGREGVRASFDAGSIRVLHAVVDGRASPSTLSESDRKKIASNIEADVLETRRFPAISFASTAVRPEGDGFVVEGKLTLHGRTEAIRVHARRVGDDLVVEHRLHQPAFGIKPFSAMLGALRIQPDVLVRVTVPAP